jgi:hydrogenase nickel incorporation protein HypA/HybF
MHEMSIAEHLIRSVEESARANAACRVIRVELEIGEMRLVVHDALRLAFEAVAEGTVAEGAELEITEIPVRMRCRECGEEFRSEIGNFVCPACGAAAGDVIRGNDIILTSMVCDVEDDEGDSR